MTPEFADTAPQAPQSPVPAGDALGPPDTHTDAQRASAVTEYGDPFTVRHWCHAEPLPHTVADAIFGLGIDPDMTLTGLRARLALTDDDLALAAAGLLCTPAEREQLNRLHQAPIDLARKGSWLIEDAVALLDYLLHGSPLDELDREARS